MDNVWSGAKVRGPYEGTSFCLSSEETFYLFDRLFRYLPCQSIGPLTILLVFCLPPSPPENSSPVQWTPNLLFVDSRDLPKVVSCLQSRKGLDWSGTPT